MIFLDQSASLLVICPESDKPARHLLTHTSGLSYVEVHPRLLKWAEAVGRPLDSNNRDLEYYVMPLVFAPGESWAYGTGLDWAGQLLEKVTGQRLGAYMQEHIFGPLGMSSTGFQPRDIPNFETRSTAAGHRSPAPDQTLTPLVSFSRRLGEDDIESGGAGLFGSPADYATFLQAVLQGRLLSPETTEAMFTPQLSEEPRAALEKFFAALPLMMLPEFDAGVSIDHGLGGVVNTQDSPGKRHRGSMAWGGMLNSRWVSEERIILFVCVLA